MNKIVSNQGADLPPAAPTAPQVTQFNYAAAAARSSTSNRQGSGAQPPALGNTSVHSTSRPAQHPSGENVTSTVPVKLNGINSNASRERRTSGITKRHNTTPSTSAISFGSLAESTAQDHIALSASPAKPPALSQRDGNPQFGGFGREEAKNPTATSSTAAKPLNAPPATSGTDINPTTPPVLAPKAMKKKYDFNSGFTSSAPSASGSGPPSNGSGASPAQAHRIVPVRSSSSFEASTQPSPGPSHLSLPPPVGSNMTHLSCSSQPFTPGAVGAARMPGYSNGGGPPVAGVPGHGWQGPTASPHFAAAQLPNYPPAGSQGTYGGVKGPHMSGYSSRTGGAPPGVMYGHSHGHGGTRSALSAGSSNRGSGPNPSSPRLANQPTPGPGGPGVIPPGYGPPTYWNSGHGGPGGPPMYPTHPHPHNQSFQGPYQGYNPSHMPSYPNNHHQPQHHHQMHAPGHYPGAGPVGMVSSTQPHPQTLPAPPSSGASTPSLAPRLPQSPVPSAATTPSNAGYPPALAQLPATSSIATPVSPQPPHGRTASLSYNAVPFSPAPLTPSPAVSEFKPNPAAISFTPRKSASIALKKPIEQDKVPNVEEEREAEEKANLLAMQEAKEKAAREFEEQRRREVEVKELEAKKKQAEEAEAARRAAEEAEQKRLEAEKAAEEAKRLEEEAKEKARIEKEAAERAETERREAERVEREAKERAAQDEVERLAKERAEAELLEQERLEAQRLEKLELEKEANEKAAAERDALSGQSMQAEEDDVLGDIVSPLSADLPSKSINGVGDLSPPNRSRPAPIEVYPPVLSRNLSHDGLPSALLSASALQSARKIEDLNQVQYPENINSPRPDFNADAPPGKFRYDRLFLLQFMNLCTEKPDQLPSLEAIGMTDASESPGFPRSQSYSGQRRGLAGSAPPLARGVSGSITPMSSSTMRVGSMAMPLLANRPPATSEERFQRSGGMIGNMNTLGSFLPGRPPGGQMSRPPSTHSITGLSGQRERVRSSRGQTRRGGAQPPAPMTSSTEMAAPLPTSSNSWASGRSTHLAEDSPEMVERKVKALLNKLTHDNFDSISDQVLAWANKSEKESNGRILGQVIALIFAKATDEAHWSELYAQLCRKLMEKISNNVRDESVKDSHNNPVTGGHLFRKYLLNRCQEDYERGWSRRVELSAAAAGKAAEDTEKRSRGDSAAKEADILSDEYYAAQKAKRQGLGLVRFIGELSKLNMLTDRIMHECIKKLLANVEDPEEEDIETLCRLMHTVGKMLDTDKAANHMRVYFIRMGALSENLKLSSRARYMLMDLLETRKNNWQSRNAEPGPKPIAEVHQDAAKHMEAARLASSKSNARLSEHLIRGGSRSGQRRDQGPVVGQDGWAQVPAHAPPPQRPSKAGDLTQFGKFRAATASLPSLGPSGIFAKGRRDGKATPDREQAVSVAVNPFAALGGDGGTVEGPPTSSFSRRSNLADAGPTVARPKLHLAPRTLPLPSQGEKKGEIHDEDDLEADSHGAENQGSESHDETTQAEPEDAMDDETAERLITYRVAEFFHVKLMDAAVESLVTLPKSRQGELVQAWIEKGISKKQADVDSLAILVKQLITNNLFGKEGFMKAFAPCIKTLDDMSVDNPLAFKFCGILFKAIGFEEQDVTKLSDTMEAEEDLEAAQARLMHEYHSAP